MALDGDFFERLQNKATFIEEVEADFHARAQEAQMEVLWNRANTQDAYFQWMQDIERIERVEDKVRRADHLKCAAHLIYWLRRCSPVDHFAFEGQVGPHQEFMFHYGREYLAFDLGYRAAQLYERLIHKRDLPGSAFSLQSPLAGAKSNDFIESASHVLKVKMVSPHALLLVLKAIFLRP